MPNATFDGTDFSTLGLSVLSHNMRQMAPWKAEQVEVKGRDMMVDTDTGFAQTQTNLSCSLSADTEDYANYTHENWLARLDEVKALLFPRKGFRKLVVYDQPDRYRWARYAQMGLTEERPWKNRPFHQCTLELENLEPYWRKPVASVGVTAAGTSIPNDGVDFTRPRVTISISAEITAFKAARTQPVTLFSIDDLDVGWSGSGLDTLYPGDILRLDSESLTLLRQYSGVGEWEDAIRNFNYSGPGAIIGDGFPVIAQGGSQVGYVHPNVGNVIFDYDLLYT